MLDLSRMRDLFGLLKKEAEEQSSPSQVSLRVHCH